VAWFSTIYLGGIPPIITNDSAFLSFICVVTAIEALSGYRYGGGNLSARFVRFIKAYFPSGYHANADALYALRKGLVHAFSTGPFELVHHTSQAHLATTTTGRVILNAEDFYAGLLVASQQYFGELKKSKELRDLLIERLDAEGGGAITVRRIAVVE
jgi:hypothetical protein